MLWSSRLLVLFSSFVFLASCFGGLLQGLKRDPIPTVRYSFFEVPASNDPWSRRIGRWQVRQRVQVDESGLPHVSAGKNNEKDESLYDEYKRIRENPKLILAYGIAKWIQTQANLHYIPDDPIYDHWDTLPEVLAKNGGDCEELELLAFWFLRDAGFKKDEVFHGIFESKNPRDEHHMVTLWFEDREDPWVIDPTGAVTLGLKRLSQVSEDWVPIKVFNDTEEYAVHRKETETSPPTQPPKR